MRYQFIGAHQTEHRLARFCAALEVSRSGYYAWRTRPASARAQANRVLVERMRQLHAATKERYGAVKLWRALRTAGLPCGRHRVARLRRQVALHARRMALGQRRPQPGLIHHTDQGALYTSVAYQRLVEQTGLVASMSRKGNCYDNAVVESFFSTLKNELAHERDYHTREEAQAEVFEFIEVFYNRQRLHQALGYVSPVQFETHHAVPIRPCPRNRG